MRKNFLRHWIFTAAMLLFSLSGFAGGGEFIALWKTDNPSSRVGNTATSIRLPVTCSGYKIIWEKLDAAGNPIGAPTTLTGLSGPYILDLSATGAGTYRVVIYPNDNAPLAITHTAADDPLKLLKVEKWGAQWSSMRNAFYGCANMDVTAIDPPDLSVCTDMSGMFRDCANLVGNISFRTWNVSNVTNMEYLFSGATKFNQLIGYWNTANVTNMGHLFYYASAFNQPFSSQWNTAKVTRMDYMFSGATAFNQNISGWNTGNVTDFTATFQNANAFNQNISGWNVGKAKTMFSMFQDAQAFNQNLGSWNTIGNGQLYQMTQMFDGSGLDCANYSATLQGWATQNITAAQLAAAPQGEPFTIGAAGRTYTDLGKVAREALVSKGISLTGDTYAPACATPAIVLERPKAPVGDINVTNINTPVQGKVTTNDPAATLPAGAVTVTSTRGVTVNIAADGTYTYTPPAGFTGEDSFFYPYTTGCPATPVVIQVTPKTTAGNNPPVANNDYASVELGKKIELNVKANDFDPDGNATLSVTEVKAITSSGGTTMAVISKISTAPSDIYVGTAKAGTAYLDEGTGKIVFTAAADFVGDVPFEYTLKDAADVTDTGAATIKVIPANDTDNVYAVDDAFAALSGKTVTGNVLTNDNNEGGTPLTVTAASVTHGGVTYPVTATPAQIPGVGMVSITPAGAITLVPIINDVPTGFTGTLSVVYTASNGTATATATGRLTILDAKAKVWTGTTSTDFNTGTNWGARIVPKEGDDVVFATVENSGQQTVNNMVIPVGTSVTLGNLTNLSDKATVIPPNTLLRLTGSVTGSETNPDKLRIEAATDGLTPNGSLMLEGQPCTSVVKGTVQMYAKGFKGNSYTWIDEISGSPTRNQTFTGSYHWQYFGIPVVNLPTASPTFDGSWVREYDETRNGSTKLQDGTTVPSYYQKWVQLDNNSPMSAFKGYEVTQDNAKIITMQGSLVFCDQSLTLTHRAPIVPGSTDTNEYNNRYGLGQNIFGNSFTAELPIDNIEFPNDYSVEKTVYLYNTASFGMWGDKAVSGVQANETNATPGMYITIPQNVASAMGYTAIPSMNGFLLRHIGNDDNDRVVTLRYGTLQKNSKPQTAPAARRTAAAATATTSATATTTAKELSYLEIELSGTGNYNVRDKLWLFSQKGTSEHFDNGWDGRKFFGVPAAYLYTVTPAGNMSVSATDNLVGTYISFIGNKETRYALTLKTVNLRDKYEGLSLVDLAANRVTPLDKDEVTYQFTATNNGTEAKRFLIGGKMKLEELGVTPAMDTYVEQKNIHVVNITDNEATVQVFDVSGKILVSTKVRHLSDEIVLKGLMSGVYVVNMTSGKQKQTLKVIIK